MYSNCLITSFKHLWFISKTFEVFNEMEMEINVINNTKCSQNYSGNKSKRKRNFIIYHFLVKTKPHERIDLLIITSVNIYQKLTKQFGNPPLSKRTPPLSTNHPISEQFFHDPPLCPIFKNKTPPLILGGRKLWKVFKGWRVATT